MRTWANKLTGANRRTTTLRLIADDRFEIPDAVAAPKAFGVAADPAGAGRRSLSLGVMLKRILAILASVLVAVSAVIMFSAASDKNAFTVSISSNPALDATFDRKEKTKDRGWKIYIRFTNKTDKPIRSIGTDFEMREGGWRIRDDRTQTCSISPLLMPKQSAVFGWIDGVPSSVDHIHIKRVETQ